MPRLGRYQLFFRLMDAAMLCQLIVIAAALFKQVTGRSAVDGVLGWPFLVIFIVAVILPTLLIFQRWMRDDFSELLWQRTAGTVLKALVILPFPILITVTVAITLGDPITLAVDGDRGLTPQVEGMMVGFVRSVAALWLVAPILFVFAFQWHRWRAFR